MLQDPASLTQTELELRLDSAFVKSAKERLKCFGILCAYGLSRSNEGEECVEEDEAYHGCS